MHLVNQLLVLTASDNCSNKIGFLAPHLGCLAQLSSVCTHKVSTPPPLPPPSQGSRPGLSAVVQVSWPAVGPRDVVVPAVLRLYTCVGLLLLVAFNLSILLTVQGSFGHNNFMNLSAHHFSGESMFFEISTLRQVVCGHNRISPILDELCTSPVWVCWNEGSRC